MGFRGDLERCPLFREPSVLLWAPKPAAAPHEKTVPRLKQKARSSPDRSPGPAPAPSPEPRGSEGLAGPPPRLLHPPPEGSG